MNNKNLDNELKNVIKALKELFELTFNMFKDVKYDSNGERLLGDLTSIGFGTFVFLSLSPFIIIKLMAILLAKVLFMVAEPIGDAIYGTKTVRK